MINTIAIYRTASLKNIFYMNPAFLRLLLIVLASVLLGAVNTFALFCQNELKLVMGSVVFSLALLLILFVQLREVKAEQ